MGTKWAVSEETERGLALHDEGISEAGTGTGGTGLDDTGVRCVCRHLPEIQDLKHAIGWPGSLLGGGGSGPFQLPQGHKAADLSCAIGG